MTINILTLFPEYFASILNSSIIGKAVDNQQIDIQLINIRDYSKDDHRMTDDRPFGGGPGMVMQVEPIDLALQSVKKVGQGQTMHTILTSAHGKQFTQQKANEFASLDQINIVCGHYEGVDQRVVDHLIDEEIRVGDYVLTGGEPATAVIIDAVARLIPGVLGNENSNQAESHAKPGLGGYPQYTRPANYQGWQVPEVLLSGNHAQIGEWREKHRKLD